MTNLMNIIRSAVRPGAINDSHEGSMPGADASNPETPPNAANPEESLMAETQNAPGTASQSAGDGGAMERAGAEGRTAGAKAANERLGTILGADGIKGDGKRMAAALELACGSPDMSADAVTNFVTANLPASTPAVGGSASAADDYERGRMAAANLAQPDGGQAAGSKANIDRNAIFAARREQQKGA